MLLVINPRAGGGTALDRWRRLETELPRNGNFEIQILGDPGRVPRLVAEGIAAGHRTFVAGGGDGTVNVLANALLNTYARGRVLGAVGLGSSNDFHKPFRCCYGGVPCRVDSSHTQFQDVGRLVIYGAGGGKLVRYWVVNSSIGITADANRLFNEATGALGWLKRVSTPAAIGAAALITLLKDRGHELMVTVDGRPLPGRRFRNLSFVKNANFAGCLHYDDPPDPASDSFHLHAVGDVSFPALFRILAGLARGRFAGRRGTCSREAATARVNSFRPFAVEFDGEVLEAASVELSIVPGRLEVCA